MTDVLIHARLSQIMQALEKMHNGLLAVIDEHKALETVTTDRIDALRDDVEYLTSQLRELQAK